MHPFGALADPDRHAARQHAVVGQPSRARPARVALAFGVCDGVAPMTGLSLGRATALCVAPRSE